MSYILKLILKTLPFLNGCNTLLEYIKCLEHTVKIEKIIRKFFKQNTDENRIIRESINNIIFYVTNNNIDYEEKFDGCLTLYFNDERTRDVIPKHRNRIIEMLPHNYIVTVTINNTSIYNRSQIEELRNTNYYIDIHSYEDSIYIYVTENNL
jgi:hypothetical protein